MGFPQHIVEDLLVKAARHCCVCRQPKGIKLEVHHIVPRSRGGTDDADNGMPLCFDCHAEVETYNDQHPRGRKFRPNELRKHREEWFRLVASGAIHQPPPAVFADEDQQLIRFFRQCFDRPAFQDAFRSEGSMEDFDKAIEDTITALNTGCLRARDGHTLARARGKSCIWNDQRRAALDVVVELLRGLRERYNLAVRLGQIHLGAKDGSDRFYCIHDPELGAWMDDTRAEVLRVFSEVCKDAGVPPVVFLGRGRRW